MPVGRLPPEILLCIFKEVAWYDSCRDLDTYIEPKERFPVGNLLAITHVCKRWRETALRCATLWTRIDNYNYAQMYTFRSRSSGLPLNVLLDADDSTKAVRFLASLDDRLKRLDITMYTVDFWHCERRDLFFKFYAPLLECLTVFAGPTFSAISYRATSKWLLAGCYSNLQALCFDRVDPGPIDFDLPRLTHLDLRFAYDTLVPGWFAFDRLLNILAHTPAIQHVHIHDRVADTITSVGTAIALPKLRSLTCSGSQLEPALRLLELLELPQDALVRFVELRCNTPEECMRAYACPSPAFFSSFTSLEVYSDGVVLQLLAQGPNSGLWIQVHSQATSWTSWLSRLTAIIPISGSSITSLKVFTMSSHIIPQLLDQLPQLADLFIYFNYARISTVTELYDALTSGPGIRCPLLQTLAMSYCSPTESLCSPQEFVKVAARRAAAGHPLRRVILDLGLDVDPTSGMVEDSEDVAAFRQVQEHVLEPLEFWDQGQPESASQFKLDARWDVPEARRWWRILSDKEASELYSSEVYWYRARVQLQDRKRAERCAHV